MNDDNVRAALDRIGEKCAIVEHERARERELRDALRFVRQSRFAQLVALSRAVRRLF